MKHAKREKSCFGSDNLIFALKAFVVRVLLVLRQTDAKGLMGFGILMPHRKKVEKREGKKGETDRGSKEKRAKVGRDKGR
jgi:hypothetical protein